MPELPEVETIRNILRQGTPDFPSVVGMEITSAEVYWERTLAWPEVDEFRRRIAGQRIVEIGRRGKFLLLQLSTDTLLVHLRMSGDLWVEPQDVPLSPHARAVLTLASSWRLTFNDPRKFGRLWLVTDPQEVVGGLGPEPLAEDFTAQLLHERLQARHRQLKPLLLDQAFLAGLGNIYSDEALHQARLHPLTLSDRLTFEQSERLWAGIRQVLWEGIRRHGTSIDWVYRGGDYQQYLRAYQRTGLPCPECGTPIERMIVGQRGTHICPNCQNLIE